MSPKVTGIGTACGRICIDNLKQAEAFGKDISFIKEKIGFTTLRRLDADQNCISLSLDAFADLASKQSISLEAIDCLVLVTQNPYNHGLPHGSAILHDALKLHSSVAAFDISLGCSGYVYALQVVSAFMKASGLQHALLFTSDPYSPVLDEADVNTQLLFGDAATCTYLSSDGLYSIGKTLMGTNGAKHSSLEIRPADGKLFMNGRDIFNFSMTSTPKQIEDTIILNGLSKDDIDCFVLHQASYYIVSNIARRMGLNQEKVPFALGDIGNCVSSTIPFVLSRLWDDKHAKIVLSGFGVGLSWASTILFNE